MKLEKFKEKNQKKRFMIIFTVCCVFLLAGVFLYTSFAVFTEEKEFNIINGMYQDPGDLYFAVYVDGEITNTFPKKEDGYSFDASQSSCTNGATVSWDNESWSAAINFTNYQATNMSRTKCTMYFKKDSTAVDFIKDLADNTNDLVYDETSDNNLRYIGANPNNYVSFNGELWRIIGVMNNIDNGSGTKETRLKIIRNESIGEYSWDYHSDGTYDSDWTTSTTMDLLNTGAYYNRTAGIYYNNSTVSTAVDFTSNGLTEEAKTMIGNAVWNLGGSNTYEDVTTPMLYTRERGDEVITGRPTTWIGQIGLMYPSDYGYATSGGSNTDRNTCLAKELYNWPNYYECYSENWLYDQSYQWTLTVSASSSNMVFRIISSGRVDADANAYGRGTIFPALYLSSNVRISGGDGSENSPFELSL